MGDPMLDDPMKYLQVDTAQMLKDQAKAFDAKKFCWVPTAKDDEEGYVVGEVVSAAGDVVTIEIKGQTKEFKKEQCDQMNPPKYEKCTDMANLTYLNEASVLYNLRARYEAGLIYTYSGLFCIAVNPYRRLPIYGDDVIKLYRGKRRPEMPPHVFSIVDNAYQDMLIDKDNQSMLITGESGAGKTENTKKVIQYIAKVAGVEGKPKDKAPVDDGKMKGSLDEQVVQANPLLEAFGNAKTTRNNNSSRFGKFIRCHFSQTGKLAGADIESYLLEKNRIVHQGSQERNYHIFYQILYAGTDEDLAKYALPSREAPFYGYLSHGVAFVDRIDDHEEYALTLDAIKVLGFTPEEHESMFKITAAILNMSCMKFKQKPRDEQAEVQDPADGERVSYLLGLTASEFLKSLCKPKVKVGTEFVNKGQSVAQVLYSVAGLSKAIFERMFLWIVERVNKALDTKERRSYFIGVLDIAGFEIFDYNSFDQLCINLTNEKLQQFFNHHMFVLEQEEYKKEGIHWEFIDFGMDLEETVNLIEKPMGIFAMLEEECIVPKATDKTYLEKLHKQHTGKSKAYGKPTAKQSKAGGGDFILHHYAGSVGYSVEGWLEKNKDPILEHTAQLFSKCTDPLVSLLFKDYDPDIGGRRKGSAFQTVSFRHKEQLKNLLGTLMSTSPHFVRCIIPNEKKTPGLIDGQLVLHQLRCNGVLEGIRICRKGFPSRMLFGDFRQRYQILAASAIPSGFVDGKVAAEKLIEALQLDESEYRVGNTKIFFRSGIVGELEEMRDERLSKIVSQFQAFCKGMLARIEYKRMCDQKIGLSVIQRNVRKFLFLRNWSWWKLYIKVQPLLSIARAEDEMKEKEEELKKAVEDAQANEAKRKELEATLTDTITEKEKLYAELQGESERLATCEEKLMSTQSLKDKLEKSLNEALEKLEGEEHSGSVLKDRQRKAEGKIEELTAKGEEMAENISRLETEKSSRDKQIATLNEDIAKQDDSIKKLGGEKKALEEGLQERTEQLQAAEDKLSQMNKSKNKVEGSLKETEHSLNKEKEAKAKVEKEKRQVEGVLKETKDKLQETEAELANAQDIVAKREKAIKELNDVQESNENTIKQLQKKIAELQARIEELEEELENERKLRQKVELARKDLESQLEEMQEQLEQAGGATTAQVEVSKKREAECGRLRRELEELTAASDEAVSSMKAKHNVALAEAQDELENVKKAKAKSDKEKAGVANELNEVMAQLEQSKKQKAGADKNNRALEEQLNELKGKLGDAEASLSESQNKNSKAGSENSNLAKSLEETEHKLGLATKEKKNLDAQLQEARSAYEDEAKAKHDASKKLQDALADIEALNEQLEEEQAAKAAMAAKMAKAVAEAANSTGKLGADDLAKIEELEDAKKKLNARVMEMEDALMAAETKAASMEKIKGRMAEEVDDLLLDLEKAQAQAGNLEKKQKKVDLQINEWKLKNDELQAELDKAQKDARTYSSDVLKMRAANEDILEKFEMMKRENKSLSSEVLTMSEQLSEGGKSSVELDKARRKLMADNEELVGALDEAEGALQQEEAKFLKIQLEFTQLKASTDKKIAERDEEFEVSRKNHQRQIEALQATVDAELKAKGDLAKGRKKYESDIIELESQLESATRNTGDYQKSIKKLQAQIKELQQVLDDEQREKDEAKDAVSKSERRNHELTVRIDEAQVAYEQSERARKLADGGKQDLLDRLAELQAMYNNAANEKRKAEGDFHALQAEIEEIENEVRAADDKAVKATSEVARLMAELSSSHENSVNADKSRVLLTKQVADLQARLEDAEAAGGKTLKNQIRKLEQRILELESDLDTEGRRSAEVVKQARQSDKKVKELELTLDDEKKANERTADAAEKLNSKLKKMRLQLEEAEQAYSALQSRYKKAVIDLEESEERAESADAALTKLRQRSKSGMSTVVSTRTTTAATSRSRSRLRTPAGGD